MKIVDNSANFVISVPISALQNVDDDSDGLLSPDELARHNGSIAKQFDRRFSVSNDGAVGEQVMSWAISPINDNPSASSDYVVVMHRVFFPAAPLKLELTTDLFGAAPGKTQMTLRASRGDESEVAILSAGHSTHRFFRVGWVVFGDFFRIGVEHSWGGADHLLFLLTIVVAGVRWRYWLAVVTSFTIAHSITLTMSALKIVRIEASLVEPAIALSIVVLALFNLLGGKFRLARATGWRVGIVFTCGLLHGFGFASAIGEIRLSGGNQFATLAGFNIGIEFGQFLFVSALLALGWIAAQVGLKGYVRRFPVFASCTAFIFGTILLIQRVGSI